MTLLFIDFETYYDTNVTLKKLNYSEYVPQAQPLLVTLGDTTYAEANIKAALDRIDWSITTLVGHNLLFDALVLKHWYGHQAASHKDTLCMARYLHPSSKHDLGSLQREFLPNALIKQHDSLSNTKGLTWDAMSISQRQALIAYNKNDVNLTRTLYDLFNPQMPKEENTIIDWTIKLWLNPTLELNKQKCAQAITEEYDRITEMLNTFSLNAETVRSSTKFYNHLVTAGYDPPTKVSPKTGKTMPAFAKTDYAFKDFCEENNIMELYELKQSANSNIKTSRAETMLRTAANNHGKIPVAYNYHGAFTGRFCLIGTTVIQVLRDGTVLDILLPELLPDDQVWDGENFVPHGGLLYQGEREIITYDGITGTPDHRVYVEEVDHAVELRTAKKRNYTLKTAHPAPRNGATPTHS